MPELHAKRNLSKSGFVPNIFTTMVSAHFNRSVDQLEEDFKENEKDENAYETWMEMVRIIKKSY
ncbi:MAG: hypothetical protein DRN68_00585 [Thaumarchaeota archaeon]|nr:MAG: hypothetical protein DRN68_00585 [Nitrososphaerota archaeon]